MRIGLQLDLSKPLPDVVADARRLAEQGFAAAVTSQVFGPDALTMLAVVGSQVPGLGLVTSVVPTWPRHPVMLASQALTVQAVTGGRLTLGIGPSHQPVIERVFGTPFAHPLRHVRDYLAILRPLLRGEAVAHDGESLRATTFGPLEVPGAPEPTVLLAALAPRMLALAGAEADGTTTWLTGPATLERHIVPSITAAAADAGRPPPIVAAGLMVSATADPDAARRRASEALALYTALPSYQAVMGREGASAPGDVAIVGDEASVADQVRHLAAIGVTDLYAVPFGAAGDVRATVELLAALHAELATGAEPAAGRSAGNLQPG